MESSIEAGTAAIQLDYLTYDDVAVQPAAWWQSVLGVVGFESVPDIGRDVPVTASMTRPLSASNLCEVWRLSGARTKLTCGETQQGGLQFRHCEDLLFATLTIREQIATDGEVAALMGATTSAYEQIFDLLEKTEHPHLIRIWNYLPEINRETGGDERYRHFNSARRSAFRKFGRATIGAVPAACALGSPAGSPIVIYFLAARQAPKMIENPRQTSAYHYPLKFGKDRPIFSRACVWGDARNSRLFISGTASIVGHETLHGGDVVAQTRETVMNLRVLLEEANRVTGFARYSLDGLTVKVYVRRPADLPLIESTLAQLLNPAHAVYLQADICREDLLVEIEAVG